MRVHIACVGQVRVLGPVCEPEVGPGAGRLVQGIQQEGEGNSTGACCLAVGPEYTKLHLKRRSEVRHMVC